MAESRPRVNLVELIRGHLSEALQEWIGHDIPDEGTEDYDLWLSKQADIDEIVTLDDALGALYDIGSSPAEALEELGVVPSDFKPSAGELYALLGQDLPPPPESSDDENEEAADARAYWISNVGRILMMRWDVKLRSMGIDPHMKSS